MSNMDLNKLIEQALFSLKEGGLTVSALNYYRKSGFGKIRAEHERQGCSTFSYEICDKMVRELRVCFENGEMPKHRWRVIRRCAEVLRNYQESGTTKLPKLGKWEWLHAPYREEPTSEQFADSENIFAVVWNIQRELERAGMTCGSVKAYTYNGFDKILKHFIALGLTKYDETVIDDFVIATRENNFCLKEFQFVRKSAALIHGYYRSGKLETKTLGKWGLRKPCEYFGSVIERFRNDYVIVNKHASRSDSSAYHAICLFVLALEDAGYYDFQNVTLKVVSGCISVMARRYTSGLKPTLSYIRAFLRFVTEQDITSVELVRAVPGSISPKRAVYSGFSPEETEKMLAAVDLSTPSGKRDYAMLLLGVRTGIRAVDVVKLKRQNIDWRGYAINIVQSKTKQPLGIPLSAEVGNAIADYILNGRPLCDSSNVFIRSIYPAKPLTAPACGNIVKKYFRKAGLNNIQNRPVGFHTLRRTFGAHLLRAGTKVDMIQELLGVRDINSVQPYLAADEVGLKSCAISLVLLSESQGGIQS